MLTRASKYLIPIGATAAAFSAAFPTTVYAASKPSNPASVYDEPCSEKRSEAEEQNSSSTGSELERFVMTCRLGLTPWKVYIDNATGKGQKTAAEFYGAGKESVQYLRTGAPTEVKIATIVAGGLMGAVFGLRRGRMRKLFYGSLGAGVASYVVYPEETKDYVTNAVPALKKYTMVAYHFLVGAPPDKPK